MGCTTILGVEILKSINLFSKDVPTGIDDPVNGLIDFVFQLEIWPAQVEK